MFLSGVQSGTRLDSRLKHAGMTDFEKEISLTQQGAGNRPTENQLHRFLIVYVGSTANSCQASVDNNVPQTTVWITYHYDFD